MTASPRVVCICGSTRLYDEFAEAAAKETLAGRIVLSVGFFSHHEEAQGRERITPEQKSMLMDLHLRKIKMSDEIFFLNVDGYIGEGGLYEIAYAIERGKLLRFLNPEEGMAFLRKYKRPIAMQIVKFQETSVLS